jgi:hypothetical protein
MEPGVDRGVRASNWFVKEPSSSLRADIFLAMLAHGRIRSLRREVGILSTSSILGVLVLRRLWGDERDQVHLPIPNEE